MDISQLEKGHMAIEKTDISFEKIFLAAPHKKAVLDLSKVTFSGFDKKPSCMLIYHMLCLFK